MTFEWKIVLLPLNAIFVENVYVVAKVKQTDDGELDVRERV